MEERVVLAKFGEIAMRGNNRHLFISQLVRTIRRNLEDLGEFYVEKEQGRLVVERRDGALSYDEVIPRLLPIFGLVGVCPGIKIKERSMEQLCAAALRHMQTFYGDAPHTFKIEARRADKNYPATSLEISAQIGGFLLDNLSGWTVDVHNPEVLLRVELRNDVYLFSKVIKTYGGLPAGSAGKGVTLLSGGIDSPVAAWMMAKRGVEIIGAYFHSPPYTSEWAKQKVVDLAARVAVFTGGVKLYAVPFTETQLYLLEHVPHDKLTIFLKRAMLVAAERIAQKEGALALITGDSIGQVASQTMEGIHAMSSVCTMPVLRPLAGFDKQEIVDVAKKIGTFDISIRPYEDCCTIFVAKHPETKPKTAVIERIWEKLTDLPKLIEEAVDHAEIIE